MRRAVFLDRDGVINRAIVRDGKPYPPAVLSEVKILPGVTEALATLHAEGFMLIVVTNQPDVARGTSTIDAVEEINNYLENNVHIDEFRTCYHDNNDNCECRKPLPGSLIAASEQHYINLSDSFIVGDRWSDIEAGKEAGCKTIFIDNHYNERQPKSVDLRVESWSEIVKFILRKI